MELATLVSYYCLKDDYNRETKILSKLKSHFASIGLSPFGIQVALHWIQTAATEPPKLPRVHAWSLMLLNDQRRPKEGISMRWQIGCPNLFPLLRSIPRWPSQMFPWVARLEDAYPRIKEELLRLKEAQGMGFQPYRAPSWASKRQASNGIGSVSHDGGDWNVFYLFLHNLDFAANRAQCPETVALIESIEGQYDHAFFSALAPQTHVTAHHGPTNKKLRCHLPLVVPKASASCRLRVGDEVISMEEGKCFVFDDSFEHEAWNDDFDQSRIVLIVDIWHPDLNPNEVKFFTFLRDAQLKQEKKMMDIDPSNDNFYSIIKQSYGTANPRAVWA